MKNQQDQKSEIQTPSDPNLKANLNLQIESNENIANHDFQPKNPINNNFNNSSKVFVEENSILSEKSYKYEEYLKSSKMRKNEENGCKSKRYNEVVKQCMNRYKKEGGRGLKTEKNEEFESIFREKNSDNSKVISILKCI